MNKKVVKITLVIVLLIIIIILSFTHFNKKSNIRESILTPNNTFSNETIKLESFSVNNFIPNENILNYVTTGYIPPNLNVNNSAERQESFENWQEEYNKNYDNIDENKLFINIKENSITNKELILEIIETNDNSYLYKEYTNKLYKLENNSWKELEKKYNNSEESFLIIPKNIMTEVKYEFEKIYGILESGKYKLKIETYESDYKPYSTNYNPYHYIEFEIK